MRNSTPIISLISSRSTIRMMGIGAAVALALWSADGWATGITSVTGVVQGTWSDPILSGNTIDGATGISSPLNNSSSAACDITGCPFGVGSFGADTLVWGLNPGSSSINFNGHFFSDVPLNTVFDAATITYFNGTSALNTLIFGATLNLRFCAPFQTPSCPTSGGLADVADPLSIAVNIVTTANTGTAAQNADWVGPFGTPQPLTFNVFEGMNSQAELYGEFVGDPQFQPTLLLSLDQNGFIGNGEPVGIPEPSTLSLILFALSALGLVRWRATRRASSAVAPAAY